MGRIDRRYKNTTDAPEIVSEKRLTFFLADATFRTVKEEAGKCIIANCREEGLDLPESPSAMVRFAVDHLIAVSGGDIAGYIARLRKKGKKI